MAANVEFEKSDSLTIRGKRKRTDTVSQPSTSQRTPLSESKWPKIDTDCQPMSQPLSTSSLIEVDSASEPEEDHEELSTCLSELMEKRRQESKKPSNYVKRPITFNKWTCCICENANTPKKVDDVKEAVCSSCPHEQCGTCVAAGPVFRHGLSEHAKVAKTQKNGDGQSDPRGEPGCRVTSTI